MCYLCGQVVGGRMEGQVLQLEVRGGRLGPGVQTDSGKSSLPAHFNVHVHVSINDFYYSNFK